MNPATGERSESPELEPEAQERGRTPIPAIVASLVSFLVALLFVPLAFLLGGGGAVANASGQGAVAPAALVGFVLIAFGSVALGFVAGGIGLWLRQAWGWWALAVLHAFFLMLNAKMMTPLGLIDYEHPRAWDAAAPYLLLHGIPTASSLLVLVLLLLPAMRLSYGVKQRPYVRRRARPRA